MSISPCAWQICSLRHAQGAVLIVISKQTISNLNVRLSVKMFSKELKLAKCTCNTLSLISLATIRPRLLIQFLRKGLFAVIESTALRFLNKRMAELTRQYQTRPTHNKTAEELSELAVIRDQLKSVLEGSLNVPRNYIFRQSFRRSARLCIE